MPNPYEPIDNSDAKRIGHGFPNAVVSIVLGVASIVWAMPGLFLLNQDYLQLIPSMTDVTAFEFNGQLISNDSIIAYSIGPAGLLAGASVGLALLAVYERFKNFR